MKLVIYSVVLNHHQSPVADELYNLLGEDFRYVELVAQDDLKGATDDLSNRPYLIKAWASKEQYALSMSCAVSADCCIFSGVASLPFMRERLKLGLLSLDMGERWLKQGLKNVLSPAILKMTLSYHLNGWKNKPLYRLCMSAFAATDHAKLGMYKGRCYKWGYFTSVPKVASYGSTRFQRVPVSTTRLMWCARFINWKHPELPILLAKMLKNNGYKFQLAMYGDGVLRKKIELLARESGLDDCVHFSGNVPNYIIHQTMRESDIFLFTSDHEEGWGAVANEAMSEGCLLIGSNEIGAIPYLVEDGRNGLIFKSKDINSIYHKVVWAIDHPKESIAIRESAMKTMQKTWSPKNAARSLLHLINDLSNGRDTSIKEGPGSKA